jgi:heavy-metal-associated domain-containing protein
MAVDAYVHHYVPGRLRLKIPAVKGEAAELRDISSAIAKAPGINQVEYNPITGSILIEYSPAYYKNLNALESGLSGSVTQIVLNNNSRHARVGTQHPPRKYGRSMAARRVDSLFKQLDDEVRTATENEIDLKFILPFGVGILGVLALRHSATTPLWLTLMIFAFNAFLGLHAPTPGELGLTAGFAELGGE